MANLDERLREIHNFGGIDALSDQILLRAFEDHAAYLDAINFDRPIIIGRKGSGKSSVYRKITSDTSDGRRSLGFAFSDYPWHHHGLQKQSGVPDEECFRESWKFFINMMFCKLLLAHRSDVNRDQSAQSAIGDIEKFVRDSYGSLEPDLSRIFTPNQKIKLAGSLNLGPVGAGAKVVDIKHLPTHYSEINRNILDAIITCMPNSKPHYICFDELDIGFDPNNDDYRQRLIGLIRAAKYANDRLQAEGLKATVIILLRDDIWHVLRFEDKNKISQNMLSEIKWTKEEGPHCIKRIMERRFTETIGLGVEIQWNDVFNEKQTMSQFRTKYDFITERGFLRPRDLIQYCNEVLADYKRKGGSGKFENAHVTDAEGPYSRYFIQELEDELHKHSAAYERYFEVLKGLLNVNFSLGEFKSAWAERKTLFDDDESPNDALQALFEFSIIGFLETGGGAAGSQYIWRYLHPRTRFNIDARSFKVHMGLKHEFDLRLFARRTTKKRRKR